MFFLCKHFSLIKSGNISTQFLLSRGVYLHHLPTLPKKQMKRNYMVTRKLNGSSLFFLLSICIFIRSQHIDYSFLGKKQAYMEIIGDIESFKYNNPHLTVLTLEETNLNIALFDENSDSEIDVSKKKFNIGVKKYVGIQIHFMRTYYLFCNKHNQPTHVFKGNLLTDNSRIFYVKVPIEGVSGIPSISDKNDDAYVHMDVYGVFNRLFILFQSYRIEDSFTHVFNYYRCSFCILHPVREIISNYHGMSGKELRKLHFDITLSYSRQNMNTLKGVMKYDIENVIDTKSHGDLSPTNKKISQRCPKFLNKPLEKCYMIQDISKMKQEVDGARESDILALKDHHEPALNSRITPHSKPSNNCTNGGSRDLVNNKIGHILLDSPEIVEFDLVDDLNISCHIRRGDMCDMENDALHVKRNKNRSTSKNGTDRSAIERIQNRFDDSISQREISEIICYPELNKKINPGHFDYKKEPEAFDLNERIPGTTELDKNSDEKSQNVSLLESIGNTDLVINYQLQTGSSFCERKENEISRNQVYLHTTTTPITNRNIGEKHINNSPKIILQCDIIHDIGKNPGDITQESHKQQLKTFSNDAQKSDDPRYQLIPVCDLEKHNFDKIRTKGQFKSDNKKTNCLAFSSELSEDLLKWPYNCSKNDSTHISDSMQNLFPEKFDPEKKDVCAFVESENNKIKNDVQQVQNSYEHNNLKVLNIQATSGYHIVDFQIQKETSEKSYKSEEIIDKIMIEGSESTVFNTEELDLQQKIPFNVTSEIISREEMEDRDVSSSIHYEIDDAEIEIGFDHLMIEDVTDLAWKFDFPSIESCNIPQVEQPSSTEIEQKEYSDLDGDLEYSIEEPTYDEISLDQSKKSQSVKSFHISKNENSEPALFHIEIRNIDRNKNKSFCEPLYQSLDDKKSLHTNITIGLDKSLEIDTTASTGQNVGSKEECIPFLSDYPFLDSEMGVSKIFISNQGQKSDNSNPSGRRVPKNDEIAGEFSFKEKESLEYAVSLNDKGYEMFDDINKPKNVEEEVITDNLFLKNDTLNSTNLKTGFSCEMIPQEDPQGPSHYFSSNDDTTFTKNFKTKNIRCSGDDGISSNRMYNVPNDSSTKNADTEKSNYIQEYKSKNLTKTLSNRINAAYMPSSFSFRNCSGNIDILDIESFECRNSENLNKNNHKSPPEESKMTENETTNDFQEIISKSHPQKSINTCCIMQTETGNNKSNMIKSNLLNLEFDKSAIIPNDILSNVTLDAYSLNNCLETPNFTSKSPSTKANKYTEKMFETSNDGSDFTSNELFESSKTPCLIKNQPEENENNICEMIRRTYEETVSDLSMQEIPSQSSSDEYFDLIQNEPYSTIKPDSSKLFMECPSGSQNSPENLINRNKKPIRDGKHDGSPDEIKIVIDLNHNESLHTQSKNCTYESRHNLSSYINAETTHTPYKGHEKDEKINEEITNYDKPCSTFLISENFIPTEDKEDSSMPSFGKHEENGKHIEINSKPPKKNIEINQINNKSNLIPEIETLHSDMPHTSHEIAYYENVNIHKSHFTDLNNFESPKSIGSKVSMNHKEFLREEIPQKLSSDENELKSEQDNVNDVPCHRETPNMNSEMMITNCSLQIISQPNLLINQEVVDSSPKPCNFENNLLGKHPISPLDDTYNPNVFMSKHQTLMDIHCGERFGEFDTHSSTYPIKSSQTPFSYKSKYFINEAIEISNWDEFYNSNLRIDDVVYRKLPSNTYRTRKKILTFL